MLVFLLELYIENAAEHIDVLYACVYADIT